MNQPDIRAVVQEELGNIAPEIDLSTIDPTADLREALDINSMDFLNFVTADPSSSRRRRPRTRLSQTHHARRGGEVSREQTSVGQELTGRILSQEIKIARRSPINRLQLRRFRCTSAHAPQFVEPIKQHPAAVIDHPAATSPYDQRRHLAVREHLHSLATKQQASDGAAAVRCHYDQITAILLGGRDDALGGMLVRYVD